MSEPEHWVIPSPAELLRLPGARRGNVDGVPVIRVPHVSLDVPMSAVPDLLRTGALVGWRRGWTFAG